jgi:hypothetical protein
MGLIARRRNVGDEVSKGFYGLLGRFRWPFKLYFIKNFSLLHFVKFIKKDFREKHTEISAYAKVFVTVRNKQTEQSNRATDFKKLKYIPRCGVPACNFARFNKAVTKRG